MLFLFVRLLFHFQNRAAFVLLALGWALQGFAQDRVQDRIQVAVAANFMPAMLKIATEFERETKHQLLLSPGSTGHFYAQIRNGAPYAVFISADRATPHRLVDEGYAVAGSQATYALGRLALWSANAQMIDSQASILKNEKFENLGKIAIANPKTAPYGLAAVEVMQALNVWQSHQSKLVRAENIAQAFHFVQSGNASMGFVALSQIFQDGKIKAGSAWIVPKNLHSPLQQDAVLLRAAKDNTVAKELLIFLKKPKAQQIIQSLGYELP